MPHYWVKDYFKHILINASEEWMQGKSKDAVAMRLDVVKAVSEQIQTAVTERNDPVPEELEKVWITLTFPGFFSCPTIVVCPNLVSKRGPKDCTG
jgi:hypothetical protein